MKECILILDNIRSVENTGSIFRTAEGLGVSRVILIGITPAPIDRFGRKRSDFAKVALGAEEMVEWKHEKEIDLVLKDLKENGYEIIALEQSENSEDLRKSQTSDKFVLVVGNEVDGVSQVALDLSDQILEIPMRGEKESLNVSVATGIALFELFK